MLISINNSKDLFYTGSAFYSSVDRANDGMKAYGSDGDTFGEMLDKKPSPVESLVERTPLELYGGTAWLPMIEDLPDITAALGRTYKYAVLNDDWFNASKFKQDTYDDPVYGENDMYIKEVTSETDNTEFTVERSWDNRDPGEIKEGVGSEEDSGNSGTDTTTPPADSDEEGTEELPPGFYTETELEQYSPVLDPPKWLQEDTQYSPSNYFTSFFKDDKYTGEAGGVTTYPLSDTVYTPYTGNTWYYNTDVQKVRQDSFNPHNVVLGSETQEEMILRALEILGDDILLRDEYVFSCVYGDYFDIFDEGLVSIYPDAKGGSGQDATYFGYFYSNTSVMDTHEPLAQPSNSSVYGNDSLVTNDYIIQCIYRAMGVNCLKTQIFFYADKEMDLDFTPIASELTIDVKNVNQIQNRVDVFNTRTNLDQYWAKAVSDGLIKETGVLTYNTLDAAYKPWAVCIGESGPDAEDISISDPNATKCSVKYPAGTWFEIEPYGQGLSKLEAERGSGTGREKITVDEKDYDFKLIDYARTEHMTLAEFCIVLKKAMDIYGEEILTEKEQTLLLLNYGTSLPYELPEEELTAVKYLMAKGILDERMGWNEELQLNDMLIILARVADPATRLTFKEITITYDQALLDAGYYPANVGLTSKQDTPIEVIGSIPVLGDQDMPENGGLANAEWVDYFLRMDSYTLTGKDLSNSNSEDVISKEVTPYFKYNADSARVDDLSSLYIAMANEGGQFLKHDSPKDFEGLKVMGLEYLKDGHAYMHIRIRADCIYERDTNGNRNLSKYNPNYVTVNSDYPFLVINSTNPDYAPTYWKVGTEGGIYRYSKASFAVPDPGAPEAEQNRDVNKYVFTWSTDYYGEGYEASLGDPYIWNGETGISISDFDAMKKEGIYPTTIMEVVDGQISRAARPIIKRATKVTKDYDTFDNVNANVSYVDRQRMLIGYASYLTASPYLEEDSEEGGTNGPLGVRFNEDTEYHNIIKVKLKKDASLASSSTNTDYKYSLVSDLMYQNGITLVHADEPEVSLRPDVIQFLGINKPEHVAVYVITDDRALDATSSEIYTMDNGDGVEIVTAYVKNNEEMLVDSNTLVSLMNTTCDGYAFTEYTLSVMETDEAGNASLLLLSFLLEVEGGASVPYNIYLYKGLNLVAVNNMITKVPPDSIIFSELEDGSLLINYRAVLGWQSGFSWESTTGAGTLMLSSEGRHITDVATITNPYSGTDEMLPLHIIEANGGKYYTVPLSVPYILSNFIILNTPNEGNWLYVVKNNDSICKDSVLNNVWAEVPEGVEDPYADTKSIYTHAEDLLSSMLGITFGANTINGSTVVAAYNLSASSKVNKNDEEKDRSLIVIDADDTKEYSVDNLGKMFFDESLSCWYYILPTVSSTAVTLSSGYTASSFLTSYELCNKVEELDTDDYTLVGKSFDSVLSKVVSDYYTCDIPFPWVRVVQTEADFTSSILQDVTLFDISCNTYDGEDYGTMLAFAYADSLMSADKNAPYGRHIDGMGRKIAVNLTCKTGAGGYLKEPLDYLGNCTVTDGSMITAGLHYDCPTGLVQVIMGVTGVQATSIFDKSAASVVYTGNIRRRYNTQTGCIVDYYGRSTSDSTISMEIPENAVFGFLNSSAMSQNLSYSNFVVSYTDDRGLLIEGNLRGSLEDRVQTPIIDWSEFTFNRLIHDVDNFASIFLIIVLNILPRICMFIFIIMIGLATVANVKPWRRFCTNVFDPYKFFTFGHATVLTIDTKLLLISSIIATATFALFMDGTLLHLISWFVQFVSAFITR